MKTSDSFGGASIMLKPVLVWAGIVLASVGSFQVVKEATGREFKSSARRPIPRGPGPLLRDLPQRKTENRGFDVKINWTPPMFRQTRRLGRR